MSFFEKAQSLQPGQRFEYGLALDGAAAFELARRNPTFVLTQAVTYAGGRRCYRYYVNRISALVANRLEKLQDGPSVHDPATWADLHKREVVAQGVLKW